MKKIMSSIMVFVLAITCLYTPQTVYGAETNITEQQAVSEAAINNEMSVEGTNSFGNLFADMAEEKQQEQEENQGYNIFSATVSGNQATVTFETLQDCTIVVAIYDEAGKKMLTSSSVEVKKDEISAVAEFSEELPDYFYLRCFMVEGDTMRPLCTQYESPNYTKEMQEFFAMTIHDFDEGRVLNLDSDETDNFAVFNDDVTLIPHKEGRNRVTEDAQKGIYVIENADESFTSLQKGELVSYDQGDGEILIFKADSVKIDGDTVTVKTEDTSMEEVFSHVKVSGKSSASTAKVDNSTCQPGTQYQGLVENKPVSVNSGEFALSFSFLDKELGSIKDGNGNNISSVKLNGSIELAMSTSVKLYITYSYLYFEMAMDYSLTGNLGLSGKVEAVDIPLVTLGFSPVLGVYIEITPSFVIEASGKIEFSVSLEGSVGFSVSSEDGVKNLTSAPKVKTELKASATIFVGMSLKPKVKVISEKVAKVSFEATLGGELEAEFSGQSETSLGKSKKLPDKIHNCDNCLDGDISVKSQMGVEAKLLNSDKLKFSYTKKADPIKIADFYWSVDRGEFGFGSCPYIYWKLEFRVKDGSKNPVEDMKISTSPSGSGQFEIWQGADKLVYADELETNSKGKAVGYLPNGEYKIAAENDMYSGSKKVTVKDKAQKIVVMVERQRPELKFYNTATSLITSNGDLYIWDNMFEKVGDETTDEVVTPKCVQSIKSCVVSDSIIGLDLMGAITKDDKLYMWGDNNWGEVGNGTTEAVLTPMPILDNIASASSMKNATTGAITKDGKLYMWGRNDWGEVGDGTTEAVLTPKLILDNIASVSIGLYSTGAITNDGELYMWGDNSRGAMGGGSEEKVLTPIPVLNDVSSVSLYSNVATAAITNDSNLYMWGDNKYGIIGAGDANIVPTPKLILEKVTSVSMLEGNVAAITQDGELYMWGGNSYGQIGDGTMSVARTPKKVLENVTSISKENNAMAALTKDGKLYMWGRNSQCFIEDETSKIVLTPTLILDDVVSYSLTLNTVGALTKDGDLYVWGITGVGDEAYKPQTLYGVASYSLGYDKVGAITEFGELYMWGRNNNGQLGNGHIYGSMYNPQNILSGVSSISLGTHKAGAITKEGKVYMWGSANRYGEMGKEFGIGRCVATPMPLQIPNSVVSASTKETDQEVKSITLNNASGDGAKAGDKIAETTNLQNIVTTGENGNASGLIPDTIYNYYVMKSKSEEQPFTADNLLYIGQALSDDSGNLHIDYEMKEEYENPQTVVVGMAQLELSDGDVTVSDIIYNGEEQDIYPIVTYQGVELEEEKDYELSGDFTAEEVGEYTITIEGIGYYKGTVSKNYKVYTDEEVPTLTPTQMPLTPEPTKTLSVTATPAPTKTLSVTATPTPKLKTEYKKLQKTYGDKAFSVAVKKNSPLKYKTSESSVATVNQKGTVTIKGCGKTDITIIDSATGFVYQYITLTVVPKKPSLSAVKTSTKKVLKIKWKKDTKADGYEIYYATNKTFSKKTAVLVKSSKTTKKTVKNLKSGKKYYVKMRAYKNWDGTKIKGSWSKVISIKVK